MNSYETESIPSIAVSGTVIRESELPVYEAAAAAVDPTGRFFVIEPIQKGELTRQPQEGTVPIRITGRWVKEGDINTFWQQLDSLCEE